MESYIIRELINYHCADYGMAYYTLPSGAFVSDFYQFTNQSTLLSIFNKKNSGKRVKINDIFLINNDNPVTTSGAIKYNLAQATNIQGGYLQTPVKHNSINNDVYPGIEVRAFGTSTQGNVLKRLGPRNLSSALAYNYEFRYNGGNKLANGRIYSAYDKGGSTPIILRYGEGISFRTIQSYYSESLFVNITIRDYDGNGGFGMVSYSFSTNMAKDFDAFSILNNESGEVIEIISIEFDWKNPANAQSGGASDSNQNAGLISICKICGSDINTGQTVTPTKMDSTNSLGDTGIDIRRYAKSTLLDLTGNSFGPLPAIHRISTLYNADASASMERFQTVSEIKAGKFSPITLNEGEGIGLFSEVIPIGGINDLIVEYTIEEIPPPPSSGGETAYAYP